MIKFLTIIFFLYYFITTITNHGIIRKLGKEMLIKTRDEIIKTKNTEIKNENLNYFGCGVALIVMFGLFISFVELIYLFFLIKYDPNKYIVVAYIIFCILMFTRFKASKNKSLDLKELEWEVAVCKLDEAIKKITKMTMLTLVSYIIDISFYIYMLWVLFIR